MEFFVPLAPAPSDYESFYEQLAGVFGGTPAPLEDRVHIIRWTHHGDEYVAEVGKGIKSTKPLSTAEAPRVLAIYEGDPWIIVREGGRSRWNNPIMAGPKTVKHVEYFGGSEA